MAKFTVDFEDGQRVTMDVADAFLGGDHDDDAGPLIGQMRAEDPSLTGEVENYYFSQTE